MHYNQFTIDYINLVKANLKISFDRNGIAQFSADKITDSDIENLKHDIQRIWSNSISAIKILETKYDATIQSGLFGLIDEFDVALKVGFLLGDRVVLTDYLFERILLKREPNQIDLEHLGRISCSLVNTLQLAKEGKIVIIPNPFEWNPESKKIIEEVADKADLSIQLMSLLNMLSITKRCQLHPYTIAESQATYSEILDTQIDNVEAIGKDGGTYAYSGILGALLSERLLNETELKYALGVPLSKYVEIVSANKDFYSNYLSQITAGGSLSAQNNIDNLRNHLLKALDDKYKLKLSDFAPAAKIATTTAALGVGAIALTAAVSVVAAPLLITGAILTLSSTLTGLIKTKSKKEHPVISVFLKLHQAK